MKNYILLTLALVTLHTSKLNAEDLSQMISPITAPTTFEDPRNISEIRPIYIHHKIDDRFVTEGGDVNVYAVQLRYAVSDRFSIIATKDGYVDFNPKSTVNNDEGFANLAGGFKYALFDCDNYITSLGLRYEAPTGEREVFQGLGDGVINPFISSGFVLGNWNFIGSSGLRVRVDEDDSSFFDANIHTSYKMGNFYPVAEIGLVNVISEGNRLPIADEGQDFFNFGSSNSEGKSLVTGALGVRYRLTKNVDLGLAYQIPLNRGSGTRILEHRVTSDLIYKF